MKPAVGDSFSQENLACEIAQLYVDLKAKIKGAINFKTEKQFTNTVSSTELDMME